MWHDWQLVWGGSAWGGSLSSAGIRQGIERVKGRPPGDHTSRAALVFTESLYVVMDWLHLILYDGRIARRLVLPEPSGAVWYSFLNLCMDMCHFAPRLPGCGFFLL